MHVKVSHFNQITLLITDLVVSDECGSGKKIFMQ